MVSIPPKSNALKSGKHHFRGTVRTVQTFCVRDHFGGTLNPSAAVEEGQFESLDIDRGILVMLDRSVVHTIRLKDGRRLGTSNQDAEKMNPPDHPEQLVTLIFDFD